MINHTVANIPDAMRPLDKPARGQYTTEVTSRSYFIFRRKESEISNINKKFNHKNLGVNIYMILSMNFPKVPMSKYIRF